MTKTVGGTRELQPIALHDHTHFVGNGPPAAHERPRRRAAEECDEVESSYAMPVEGKAYQRAALCVTAKLARLCPLRVNSGPGHQRQPAAHVRFAPKADK
jgi:hypothetical protein